MSSIYVAVYAEEGATYDDPVWVVGAFSNPDRAKRACQLDAEHRANSTLPTITWLGHPDDGTYWTTISPYGYRIARTGLDAHAGPEVTVSAHEPA